MLEPASFKMARMLAIQAAVFSAMLALAGRTSPDAVAGICPETKTRWVVTIA